MTAAEAGTSAEQPKELAFVSEIFHALSQPLTALECGLELSLREDGSVAQFRARVESALASAELLHQRLLEARALQDAGDAGDTSLPVAMDTLLSQLREDLLPAADSAEVTLDVTCEPAMVRGNVTRIRNGFFRLFEFLLRTCPCHHMVRIVGRCEVPILLDLRFSIEGLITSESGALAQTMSQNDLGLRIAQRTIEAAGGELKLTQDASGQVSGYVRLLLAK